MKYSNPPKIRVESRQINLLWLMLLLPLLLMATGSVRAELQTFVYAYSFQGTPLSATNAATQCPEPDANFAVVVPCRGVLADADGNYSLQLANGDLETGDLLIVAHEFDFLAAGSSSGITEDTYLLLDSHRRADSVTIGEENNGWDVNALSEAIISAIESVSNLPASELGEFSERLVMLLSQYDMAQLSGYVAVEEMLAYLNLDQLTPQEEQLLMQLVKLLVTNSGNTAVYDYIAKTITQALLDPEAMTELVLLATDVVDSINTGGQAVLVLEAERYLVTQGETLSLTTTNSVGSDQFFAYTWFGAEGDTHSGTFRKDDPGSYMVCVTGEIDNANDSSTDCVRIVVIGPVEAIASSVDYTIAVGASIEVSGESSINADSFAWSGAGNFANANASSTTWTAPLSPGNYELTLTVNGEHSDSITIEVYDLIPIAIAKTDTPILVRKDAPVSALLKSFCISSDGSAVDGLSWRIAEQPDGASATLSSNSTVTTTFTADRAGLYTIQLQADRALNSDTATVQVLVEQQGMPMAIAGSDRTTFRENVLLLDGRGSYHPDDLPITYLWSVTGGDITQPTNPVTQYSSLVMGEYVATLTVSDETNSVSDSLNISVINRPPQISDDSKAEFLDGLLEGQVVARDGDLDTLTYELIYDPSNGGLTLNPDTGAYWYIPGGEYGCKYHPDHKPVDNGDGGKDVPVIKLCADKYNIAPGEEVIVRTSSSINASKINGYEWINAMGNGNPADFSSVTATFSSTELGIHEVCIAGTVGNSRNTSTACVQIEVSDIPNSGGGSIEDGFIDHFQARVNDGHENSRIATINVNLNWRNIEPVAQDGGPFTINEDQILAGDLLAVDEDNHVLRYEIVSNGALGTAVISDVTNGTFIYTPNANVFGSDTFTYKVNDGYDDSNIATVTIDIASVNDAPAISIDSMLQVLEDQSVSGIINGFDAEGNLLTYQVISPPALGTVQWIDQNSGSFTYIPNADANGLDEFVVVANDGQINSNELHIRVEVIAVNDAPTIDGGLQFSTWNDIVFSGQIIASDKERDALTYHMQTQPAMGILQLDIISGEFTFIANSGAMGSDTATIYVDDGSDQSELATLNIEILPANKPPVADNQSITVVAGVPYFGNLTGSDPENAVFAYALKGLPSLGVARLIDRNSGTFRYNTNSAPDAVDFLTFQTNDGQKLSEAATVQVNIIGSDRVCRGPGHTSYDQDGDGFADYVEIAFGTAIDDVNDTPLTQLPNTPYNFNFIDDDDSDGYTDIIELWMSTNHLDGADSILASPVSIPFCLTPSGDLQPPAIQGFAITTPTLDVSGGDAQAGFVVTAIDNAVGINRINVTLVSPSGEVRKIAGSELETPMNVLFTMLETDLFSQYSEAGEWLVESLEISDAKNNVTLLNTAALVEYGYPTIIQVINADPDVTPPEYTFFEVITDVVDLSQPNPIASFNYTATDDLSGVALIELTLQSPSGKAFKYASHKISPSELSISAQLDTDLFSIYAESGIWQVSKLIAVDEAGKRAVYDTVAIQLAGWETDVEVINPQVDVDVPLEEYFKVLTPRLNATTGNTRAVCAVTAHDTESGVKEIRLHIVSPSGNESINASFNSLRPSTTLSVDIPSDIFPRNSELGVWDVAELIIIDGSGNERVVTSAELNSRGFSTDIELINPIFQAPEKETEAIIPGGVAANTPPIAYCDSYSLNEDSVVENPLRGYDEDGDPLNYYLVDRPTKGSVELLDRNTGDFRYTPDADFYGSDSFSFMVDDGEASSNTCSIQVTTQPVVDEPIANDLRITTLVNTMVSAILTGGTPENLPVTFEMVDPPTHGTVAFVHGQVGLFQYTPDNAYIGPDSFTFVSKAGELTSPLGTVHIQVLPYSGTLFEIREPMVNRAKQGVRIRGYATPPIAPQDIYLMRVTLTSPSGAEKVLTRTDFSESTVYPMEMFRIVSDTDELGHWRFSNLEIEMASDRTTLVLAEDIAAAGFDNTVEVVDNSPPVAVDAVYEVVLGELLEFNLSASDAEGDSLTYTLIDTGSKGVAELLDPNSSAVEYNAHTLGGDQVTFKVNDGFDDSNIATVTINVIPPEEQGIQLPVAFDDEIDVPKNTAQLGNLRGSKGSASAIIYTIVDQPAKGSVSLVNNQTGEYIYRPHSDVLDADSFTFQASGDGLTSRLATISINIIETNGVPTASNMELEVYINTSMQSTLFASDPDGDTLTYQLMSQPALGSVEINSVSGEFIYTSSTTQPGEDSFTFRVNDGLHDSSVATVSINIISDLQACGTGGIYLSDIDGDGYSNSVELIYGTNAEDAVDTPQALLGSLNFDGDSDGDGYYDYLEEWVGTNLQDANSAPLNLDPYYLPTCFQPSSDGIKPRLQGFKVLSNTLDINGSNNVLEIAMVISDNASGVRRIRVGLLSPSGEYFTSSVSLDSNPRLDGVLFRASGFSQFAEEGQWHIAALTLFDEAGNVLSLNEDELNQAELLTTFDVVNGNSDATPPNLVGLTIVNSVVEPQVQGDNTFQFELNLSDSGAGVSSARIDLVSPSGAEISIAKVLDTPIANAVLSMQSDTVSAYLEMGDWMITGIMAFDAAGNSIQLVDQLTENTVNVNNPWSDNTPPVLDLFAVMTDTVYPYQGGQKISYSLGAYDNAAGIDRVYINLRGPSGQLLPTWGGMTTPVTSILLQVDSDILSTLMEEGEWHVESVEVIDEAGNRTMVNEGELTEQGYSTTVNVIFQ